MKKLLMATFIFGNIFAFNQGFAGTGQIGSSEERPTQPGNHDSIESRPKPVLTDEQLNRFNNLIEQNVDPRFQPLAKSLLERAPIKNVRVVKGHPVIDLDTKGMYFEAIAHNEYSISDKKSLGDVTTVPFPSSSDLRIEECNTQQCLRYTKEYMNFRRELGHLVGPEVDEADPSYIKTGMFDMNWKSHGLLQPRESLLVTFIITAEKTTFTDDGFLQLHKCFKSVGSNVDCGEWGQEVHLNYEQ